MIYTLVGTNAKLRERALQEIAKLGSPTSHLYTEHLGELSALVEARNLFGEKVIVYLIQVLEKAEGRDSVYELLQEMKESENSFIFDEPFADVHRIKKLEKYSTMLYDAREEKEKERSPFGVCNALARRDKKNAWLEFMAIKDVIEPEAIQGALWWKFQTVWLDVLQGKDVGFSLSECERIGGEIMRSSILAHRGELDLSKELERIVLSI